MNKFIRSEVEWDFSNIDEFLSIGFTDSQLEQLCEIEYQLKDIQYGQKHSPWLFWTAELYSYGKCYRRWLGWSNLLPIPVYSDHGADPEGDLFDHEISNLAKYHLCFYSGRYKAIKLNPCGKVPIRIQHPWVTYRKIVGYEKNKNALGCLVFVPHTVPGVKVLDFNKHLDSLLREIKARYGDQKIGLCIHMHDIRAGLHKQLRRYELPIFTFGNSGSNLFVDRFYRLVANFSAAASPNSGSQLYYCVEFGLDYHLTGESVTYTNISHDGMPKGELLASDIRRHALMQDDYFFRYSKGSRTEAEDWVKDVLGIEGNVRNKVGKLRMVFVIELVRLTGPVSKLLVKRLAAYVFSYFPSCIRHKIRRILNGYF